MGNTLDVWYVQRQDEEVNKQGKRNSVVRKNLKQLVVSVDEEMENFMLYHKDTVVRWLINLPMIA